MPPHSTWTTVFIWWPTGNNGFESVRVSGPCRYVFSDFIGILHSNIIILWGEMGEAATVFGGREWGWCGGRAHGLTVFFLKSGSFGLMSAEIFSWQQFAAGSSPLEGAVTFEIPQQPRLETALEAPRKGFLHIVCLPHFWKLWIILNRYCQLH